MIPAAPPPPWVLAYSEDALALDGVVAVPPPVLVGENVVRMDVFSDVGRASDRERELVDEVRALSSPAAAQVKVGRPRGRARSTRRRACAASSRSPPCS